MIKFARMITMEMLTWRAIFPMETSSGNWQKLPLGVASFRRHVLNADFDLFRLRDSLGNARADRAISGSYEIRRPRAPGFFPRLYFAYPVRSFKISPTKANPKKIHLIRLNFLYT